MDSRKTPGVADFKLRIRSDLEIYPQRFRSRKAWVIKDPVSLRYYQFREEEFEILRWLHERLNLEQIKTNFEKRFAPQRMTVARLHGFIVQLHRNGLVIADVPGQGDQLWLRYRRHRKQTWMASLSNPLAIRFRGLDPQSALERLYPHLRWCFSPVCVTAGLLFVLLALMLVGSHYDQFQSRLPELNALISPLNLFWLAMALGLTKLLHEMGHALTCTHYGGDCHEMGLMLLVFTPCLYCNVTDTWKLSSRWQRVAIAAAGIYVEVVLASICTLLWWFSQPGFFNTVCLNVMVVCSVGTVLLNGNPLLRYDGYYILSDLLEAPNLWQESRMRVTRLLSRCFWGFDPAASPLFPRGSNWMLLYAMCSMIYRVVVVVSIVYLLFRFLQPRGFALIAQLLTALVLVGVFSMPVASVVRTLANPFTRRRVKPLRVLLSCTALVTLGGMFFLVPLPCRINAAVTIHPDQARRVYVSVPGRLLQVIESGTQVNRGDLLARLENTEMQCELERVRGQCLQQRMRVRSLESLRAQRTEFGDQLPAAKEILSDLEQRLTQLSRDLEALSLVAPVSGIVLPPAINAAHDKTADGELGNWIGTPLEMQNTGCHLERRTLLCMIGQPEQYEAVVYIDQASIRYVREGQPVRLLLDVAPGQVLSGTVSEISRNKMPKNAVLAGEQARGADSGELPLEISQLRPEETIYQAHVRMNESLAPLVIGASGWAKIQVAPQPLSLRLYRFLQTTFKPFI